MNLPSHKLSEVTRKDVGYRAGYLNALADVRHIIISQLQCTDCSAEADALLGIRSAVLRISQEAP